MADDLMRQLSAVEAQLTQARTEIARQFVGQDMIVEQALSVLLAGGHGLLVGVPGLGKTQLVNTLATVLGLNANRVQFTPDLMPSDILGSEVLETDDTGRRAFKFIKGPVFCQLLMADEINRASPRTQSALLQAMQEREVTIAGGHHDLGAPFHVLATQNPLEQEGTYPLPEAQLDRFLLQINLSYPSRNTERDILLATTGADQIQVSPVMTAQDVLRAQEVLRRVPVGEKLVEAILDLVRSCRPDGDDAPEYVVRNVAWGPGPRASQALMLLIRARAILQGRMVPEIADLQALAAPALRHRMALNYGARAESVQVDEIIDQVCDKVCAPK